MTAVAVGSAPLSRVRWIHSASADLAIAFAWVPFAAAAVAVRGDSQAIATLMSATLLLSFAHQPLTLALVYGDADQFAVRRRIFTWSPLIFAIAVLVAFNVSFIALAVVGGVWNAVHTLFQRYGLVRIYGRKVGEDDGRLERWLLLSWLVGVAILAAADPATPDRIIESGLAGHNRDALRLLTDFRPAAQAVVPLAVVAAIALSVAWVRREVRVGPAGNPAKQLYVVSTAALFALMLIAPIAGLIGYVGSHAFEYFVIVYTNLKTRYHDEPGVDAPIARAVRTPFGRPGFLVVYLGALAGLVFGLEWYGNITLYVVVFFVLGGLHVFYDGFIWKLRRNQVARSFDIASKAAV